MGPGLGCMVNHVDGTMDPWHWLQLKRVFFPNHCPPAPNLCSMKSKRRRASFPQQFYFFFSFRPRRSRAQKGTWFWGRGGSGKQETLFSNGPNC